MDMEESMNLVAPMGETEHPQQDDLNQKLSFQH
jgi:hypothetical protein